MNKIISFFVGMAFLLCFSVTSQAEEEVTLLKKVDYFSILLDQSGSMYMSEKVNGETKMSLAKKALSEVVKNIPELSYYSYVSLVTKEVTLYDEKYSKETLLKNLEKVKEENKVFGRMTNLHSSLEAEQERGLQARRKAVLLVTDGDWNRGENPVDCVKELYQKQPNCTVYVISLADTKKGEKTLSEITQLKGESLIVSAEALLNEKTAKEFAEYVFYGKYTPVVVQFDFDKFNIKENEEEKLISLEKTNLLYDEIIVNGYTCTIGTEKYNQKLSERRAESVAKRLKTDKKQGFGESEKFKEKALNRRSEILLK